MGRIGLPPDWQIKRVHTPLSEVVDWSHEFLHLTEDYYGVDCSQQRIAVLDTGAPEDHPDLELAGVFDWTNSRSEWRDLVDHGTWCEGCIAAIAKNDRGVRGLTNAKLYSEKVLDDFGSGTDDTIIAGIKHADEVVNADGLSMSLGGSSMSTRVHAAMRAFLARRPRRFIVCAAGNDGPKRPINYPARWTDACISVAAVGRDGRLTRFSCWSDEVTCSGPGDDMISTIPSGYGRMSGTSMATPVVAGIMTVIKAKHEQVASDTPVDTVEQQVEHVRRYAKGKWRTINPTGMMQEFAQKLDEWRTVYQLAGWRIQRRT